MTEQQRSSRFAFGAASLGAASFVLYQLLSKKYLQAQSKQILSRTDKLLSSKPFDLVSDINWNEYKTVLITGMGGGCDVFSAFALHQYVSEHVSNPPTLHFGNCIGPRASLAKHAQLVENFYQVSCHSELAPNKKYYGDTALEESLYQKERSDNAVAAAAGPYLTVIPLKRLDSKHASIDAVTKYNSESTVKAWNFMKYDLVIAVDNGGDSLTGGIDFKDSFELGRDRQVLHALDKYAQSGFGKYIHLVFGPGCDGESSMHAVEKALKDSCEKGSFIGCFEIKKEVMDCMREKSKILGSLRTPAIIYDAYESELKDEDLVVIKRHVVHQMIAKKWLKQAWCFTNVTCKF